GDLARVEAEVDGNQDAPPPGHAVQRDQEAGRVLADDRDAFAALESELVEGGGLRARQLGDASVRDLAESAAGCVRLVHDPHAIRIDRGGAIEVVANGQRYAHESPLVSCAVIVPKTT